MNEIIKTCSHRFSNGVVVVNTTPHPIRMLDINGGDYSYPCSVKQNELTGPLVINARAVGAICGKHTVRTQFAKDESAETIISAIKECYADAYADNGLMIVGSIIAANTYHDVVAMPLPWV